MFWDGGWQGKQRALKGKAKQKATPSIPCEGSQALTSQAALPSKGASANGASTCAHVHVHQEQEAVHLATLVDDTPVEPTALGKCFS